MARDTQSQHLDPEALGLAQSIAMGVAGTAPSFSVAATMAALIASVGVLAAASLLYSGLIMFGVTLAFMYLNRIIINAGASYAWVGKVFHPVLGFFAGWAVLVSSTVFMVSGTIPAATATLALLAPDFAAPPEAVVAVATVWLLAVSAVVIKGIKLTSYAQFVITVVEVSVLICIIIAAGIEYGAHPAHAFSWRWLSALEFSPASFAAGALTSLFFFWGWDVTLNLNEETRKAARTAGYGAIAAMIIVMLLFMLFAIAALLVLSDSEIGQSGTSIIFALAAKLFPRPWDYVAVIAVMLSSICALVTTILGFTRTLYAQARDRAVHPRYAILHPVWHTPWVATAVIVIFGLLFMWLSLYLPTVDVIIRNSINAIGFQIAFYYSLTGYACAWRFRQQAFSGLGSFLLLLLWPVVSASFLVFIAIYSIPTFDLVTVLIGIGGIALGGVPLLLNRLVLSRQTA
jgi:amino acid transporter